jgi:hypothetical protein
MSNRIRRITVAALVMLVACLSGLPAAAQTQDIPVITSIEDFEASVAPTLQIQSDGFGVYRNSRDIGSVIQSGSGDFVLSTRSKFSTRGVKLDFSRPVAGSGPGGGAPIPLPNATYQASLTAKCHLYGNDLLQLVGGQIVPCPLTIGFEIGSDGYRIQMNPMTGVYVYPDTNFVNVECTGTSPDTQCNQWTLGPSGVATDGSLRNRANLTKIVTKKGKTTEFNQGDFYFSFSVRLTKQ